MTTRIAVVRRLPNDLLARIREHGEVIDNQADAQFDAESMARHIGDADALLASVFDRVDAALLARCPKLKVVANIGVGYNNIDVAACSARGIQVTNTPGMMDDATADVAFGLMLAAARRLVEADSYVKAGKWTTAAAPLFGLDVHHRKLGIVGLGRIGKVLVKRGHGFDMDISYYNRRRIDPAEEQALGIRYADLATLIKESDFLVLQVPYGPETHHLIGAAELAQMKKTAVLVNTARGGVVDDAALAAALKAGTIAAAGLDVVENEPQTHPDLLTLPNVVIAPHIGSATLATRYDMAALAVSNLIAAVSGQRPPNLVNPA